MIKFICDRYTDEVYTRKPNKREMYNLLVGILKELHIRSYINTKQYRSAKGEFKRSLRKKEVDFKSSGAFQFTYKNYKLMNTEMGKEATDLNEVYDKYSNEDIHEIQFRCNVANPTVVGETMGIIHLNKN